MIEFVVGIDRGRGTTSYLAQSEGEAQWIAMDRKGAKGFPNLEEAKRAASEYLLALVEHDGLFGTASMTLGLKIEVRLELENTGDISDDEAKGLLDLLVRHYKEPVLPMSRFCEAISTWFHCIEQVNAEERKAEPDRKFWQSQGRDYYQHLHRIELDIRKSNLLARLLYGGEKLRTRKCPEHQGHWRGIGTCPHGCQLTGWLPEPESYVVRVEYEEGPARYLAKDDDGWHTTHREKAHHFETRAAVDKALNDVMGREFEKATLVAEPVRLPEPR